MYLAKFDYDCIIVGAGAAGLSALVELDRAGYRVACLEARDRIGGRILTVRDSFCPIPVELGPEFVHGRPPEVWDIIRSASLPVYDCADAAVHVRNGKVQTHDDAWEPVDRLMTEMQKAASEGRDQTFAEFLDHSSFPSEAKELSTSFVEGFNAARKDVIGIASLSQDRTASAAIDGDRSFRLVSGYDSVMQKLFQRVSGVNTRLCLNTVVTDIEWRAGSVTLNSCSFLTGQSTQTTAGKLILTVPLGVLGAEPNTVGYIRWNPIPHEIIKAAAALAFGQVIRIVFRFQKSFWEDNADFADAGFFLSNEELFPAWWTPLAVRAPILTGWSAGPHADRLLGLSREAVVNHAIQSVAGILGINSDLVSSMLEQVYFHNWHADPFARGAYSYVPAGAMAARQALAVPVEDTLFFAGEATELNGHSATVHGAIASGRRAAQQVIRVKGH